MIPNYWDKFSFYILKQKSKGIAIGYYFEYISDEIKRIEGKNKKRIRKRYPYLFEKKEEN
jgi:ribosomal protein L19